MNYKITKNYLYLQMITTQQPRDPTWLLILLVLVIIAGIMVGAKIFGT